MTMRVALRADASVTIGTGHVMRCLTLAETLKARGVDCRFVTRDLPGHLGALIAERGFAVSLLGAPTGPAPSGPPDHAAWAGVTWQQDLADTRAAIKRVDWLIVDHYAFDVHWQTGLADRVGRIMVIDDLADRPHAAALLLDQNLGRKTRDYHGLVPDDCRILTGPRFALLRPEFAAQREASLTRRKGGGLAQLMISMGGTDAADATSVVLRALARADLPGELRISVVMGSRAPSLERVRALAAEMHRPTEVLVDVHNMAALMGHTDLAIGAGGSTTWERCCLGLPTIMVETAANQAGTVAAMQGEGAALSIGPLYDLDFGAKLAVAVGQAMAKLDELSARSSSICDGTGASRIVSALFAPRLAVRLACIEDAETIWRWRNDVAASAFYLNPDPTPLSDHLAWFGIALASEDRRLLVIEIDRTPVAHVRLDLSGNTRSEASVSIYINPAYRGKGLGSAVLISALSSPFAEAIRNFTGQVHADNVASRRVFESAGFVEQVRSGDFLRLGWTRSGSTPGAADGIREGSP